jgi:hypothetical protein
VHSASGWGSRLYDYGDAFATTARRFEDAERRFNEALEIESRMRARPWLAHAQHSLAAMLLTRHGPGDRDRANALLDDARAAYHALDVQSWAARCDELDWSTQPIPAR